MSITRLLRNKRVWLLLGFILVALPLGFNGCGSEYETPSTTRTPTALISAATLKEWIDAGKVNGSGYDKVLILDVTTQAAYETTPGHIPGALWVNSATVSETRNEGIANTANMVLSGASMDALIQGRGIDGATTIVFTGASLTSVTYAYWVFRYWGFPKNRLKVLDGLNNAANMVILGPAATGAQPTVASSPYSVTNNGHLRKELRASLVEMISVAEGGVPNARPIDARQDVPYPPAPTGIIAFGGVVKGSQQLPYNSASIQASNIYASTDTLIAAFTGVGLDSTKTAYVYCASGFRSAVLFFALDGILGWPVVLYDASWNQWGTLAGGNPTTANNNLTADSPWRTDVAGRSDSMTYNGGAFTPLTSPDYTAKGNDLEEQDLLYMRSGSGGSGSGGGAPGC